MTDATAALHAAVKAGRLFEGRCVANQRALDIMWELMLAKRFREAQDALRDLAGHPMPPDFTWPDLTAFPLADEASQ